MKTATRLGLGISMAVLAAGLAGCGGDAIGQAAKAPDSPGAGYAATEAALAQPSPMPQGFDGDKMEAPPAPPPAVAAEAKSAGSARRSAEMAPPVDRPGLGTEWGETRFSRISTVSFVRADSSTPFSSTGLFYNDEEGARAMASSAGFRRSAGGLVPMAGGAVSVGLREEGGRFLSGYTASGKNFVVGEAGQRYTIILRNNTDLRFEVVMSVDGLDVMDGKDASFKKRGYIVDPRSELEVDGFRQSSDTVAAFRFGSVRNSYANQKHGDTRNVGVIGVALFHERGTNPFAFSGDIRTREQANPFPGQFASPP
jgi:hypothetical protein